MTDKRIAEIKEFWELQRIEHEHITYLVNRLERAEDVLHCSVECLTPWLAAWEASK